MSSRVLEKPKSPPVPAVAGNLAPDWRIRRLVGEEGWANLPQSVQARFSKPATPGQPRVYRGRVIQTRLSRTGWLLAQMARLVGSPIPLENGATGPSTVSVADDDAVGGQIWTRIYARPGRFPQAVNSAKRFRGPTGLEEYIGRGIAMELTVTVEAGNLVFRSMRYVIQAGPWRIPLPPALSPGRMEIVHAARTASEFSFRLTLTHVWLGEILRQEALFSDA